MFRYFDNVLAISNGAFSTFLVVTNGDTLAVIMAIINTAILILRNMRRVLIEIGEIWTYIHAHGEKVETLVQRWKKELKPDKNDLSNENP